MKLSDIQYIGTPTMKERMDRELRNWLEAYNPQTLLPSYVEFVNRWCEPNPVQADIRMYRWIDKILAAKMVGF
jgi:hypothetical protein